MSAVNEGTLVLSADQPAELLQLLDTKR